MSPRKLKDEFGPGSASDVVAACQTAIPRATRAFSRAFGTRCRFAVDKAEILDLGSGGQASGAGLLILLPVGKRAALLLLSESAGVLPDWYHRPNAIQAGKLSALAQELGKVLLPSKFAAKDCAAAAVADLDAALIRGACSPDAVRLSLTIAVDGGVPGVVWLVWPIDAPASVFDRAGSPASGSTAGGAGGESSRDTTQCQTRSRGSAVHKWADSADFDCDMAANYRRGLLAVKVPLTVTLATGKQAVGRVLQVVPGAILQFEKSCAASLDLETGGRRIGQGLCVQIGSRLGLLVTSLAAPANGRQDDGSAAR